MTNYVVATTKSWNIKQFRISAPDLPGNWFLITDKSALTQRYLEELCPAYIFFPHWSWMVPEAIVSNHVCVCFHMTDLPYGRGGSPLQNLIARGHTSTKLTALRMTPELDAGPVYKKVDLSLNGTAQSIFESSAKKSYELIRFIVERNPMPQEQLGEVTKFERRNPGQGEFLGDIEPVQLYDLIRMLDAETYPHAFAVINDYKLEFTNASVAGDTVTATVVFRKKVKNE